MVVAGCTGVRRDSGGVGSDLGGVFFGVGHASGVPGADEGGGDWSTGLAGLGWDMTICGGRVVAGGAA